MQYRAPNTIPTHIASGRERLARLAAFLEEVSPDRLTLARWYADGKGCAVGLAAGNEPWFQAQGLRLERHDSLKDCRPVYAGESEWRAVVAFFEISLEDATRLFVNIGYGGDMRPHPKRVARKIREHLAATEPAVAEPA